MQKSRGQFPNRVNRGSPWKRGKNKSKRHLRFRKDRLCISNSFVLFLLDLPITLAQHSRSLIFRIVHPPFPITIRRRIFRSTRVDNRAAPPLPNVTRSHYYYKSRRGDQSRGINRAKLDTRARESPPTAPGHRRRTVDPSYSNRGSHGRGPRIPREYLFLLASSRFSSVGHTLHSAFMFSRENITPPSSPIR